MGLFTDLNIDLAIEYVDRFFLGVVDVLWRPRTDEGCFDQRIGTGRFFADRLVCAGLTGQFDGWTLARAQTTFLLPYDTAHLHVCP